MKRVSLLIDRLKNSPERGVPMEKGTSKSTCNPFYLSVIPQRLLLKVMQKLPPRDYCLLRRTCKTINNFGEEHRGLLVQRFPKIDILPALFEANGHMDVLDKGEKVRIVEDIISLSVHRPNGEKGDRLYKDLPLNKAHVIDVQFNQVIAFPNIFLPNAVNVMEHWTDGARESYWRFLRGIKWNCEGMLMDLRNTPMEIVEIVRPRTLLLISIPAEPLTLPIETETVCFRDVSKPQQIFSNIPSHVKNLLLDTFETESLAEIIFVEHFLGLWHNDALEQKYIQMMHSYNTLDNDDYRPLLDGVPVLYQDLVRAVDSFMTNFLENTAYNGKEQEIMEGTEYIMVDNSRKEYKHVVSNVRLVSKSGKEALLVIRLNKTPKTCHDHFTLYFFAGRRQIMTADDEHIELGRTCPGYRTRAHIFEQLAREEEWARRYSKMFSHMLL